MDVIDDFIIEVELKRGKTFAPEQYSRVRRRLFAFLVTLLAVSVVVAVIIFALLAKLFVAIAF
jgi:hypothetical protein